jgi:hypothetical protein
MQHRHIALASIAVAVSLCASAALAEPVGMPPDFWSQLSAQVQISAPGGDSVAVTPDLEWLARSSGNGFRLASPAIVESHDTSGNLLGTFSLGSQTGGGFWFDPDPILVFAASAVNHSTAPLLYSFTFNMPLVPSLSGPVESYAELGVTLTDGANDGAYARPLVPSGSLLVSYDLDAGGWGLPKNVDVGSQLVVAPGSMPGTAQQIFWRSGALDCNTSCVTMSSMLTFLLSPGDSVAFSGRIEQRLSAVPLPAGFLLLASGLLGLTGLRRKSAAGSRAP